MDQEMPREESGPAPVRHWMKLPEGWVNREGECVAYEGHEVIRFFELNGPGINLPTGLIVDALAELGYVAAKRQESP